MDQKIAVTFKGEYIQAESNGKKSFEFVTELWIQITQLCEKHNCFKVLGIANTSSPISTIESVQHIELFERLKIDNKYRIAWVELNHEHAKATHLTEVFLSSNGIDCKVLSNIQEAKKWLFFGKLPDE